MFFIASALVVTYYIVLPGEGTIPRRMDEPCTTPEISQDSCQDEALGEGSAGANQRRCEGQAKLPMKSRWLILVLASIIMLGLYYLISMPASVYQHAKEVMPKAEFEAKYQLQFTMAHLPGTVLPLFAGAVVDKFGGKVCLLVLSTTCLIGQITSSFGVQQESWSITLAGRFIYGLGFESLFTANQAFLTIWFAGRELGFAIGVSSAASYVGFLLSHVIGPIAANSVSVAFSFWVGAIFMGISVLAAGFIFAVDRKTENGDPPDRGTHHGTQVACITMAAENNHEHDDSSLEVDSVNEEEAENNTTRRKLFCLNFSEFSTSFWLLCVSSLLVYMSSRGFINIASGLLLERNLFIESNQGCELTYPGQCSLGYLAPPAGNPVLGKIHYECTGSNHAPTIPSSLNVTTRDPSWDEPDYAFQSLSTSDIDCTDEFWSEACTSDYCDRQEEATEKAGIFMTIPYIVMVATIFLFGHFVVDRAGWRVQMLTFGPVLLLISHAMFAFLQSSPITPLIIHGLGHSISVSALWPSVPLVVQDKVVGTAFGVMTCIQNVGLAFAPLIIAAIHNSSGHKYLPEVEIFLTICSGVAIFIGIALFYSDRRSGGKLRQVSKGGDAVESDT